MEFEKLDATVRAALSAASSWMPLAHNPDGSLVLYIEHESPAKDHEANWLPAPKGPFNLLLRMYSPKAEAFDGRWNPPPVVRVQEPAHPQAQ